MKESFKKIIGFDTETIEKDKVQKFFSFQCYSPELELDTFCTEPDLLNNLFTAGTQGCYLICANAEFDISVIAQILKHSKLKIEMTYTPSKLIRATIKDEHRHTWHILDIFNVFPRYSVEKLGTLLKVPKLKRPDYLGKREPLEHERKYFIQYAMRDAEIAYKAARMVIGEFGKIKATLPSLSMSIYRKHNRSIEQWIQPVESIHRKIQLSFRGGRVESFYRGTIYDDVFAYDVRSLYPSVMANGIFPDINDEPTLKSEINFDKEGVALCTIKQDTNIPALAIKYDIKDYGKRLVFPNGFVKNWFTYPELRYLETHGYGKIIKVHEAIEYKSRFSPFKTWIEFLFERRAKYLKDNDERAEMYKLMMNSLYGKFAQNLSSSLYEFDMNKVTKIKEQGGMSKYTHFILASYVTAQGRIRLHRYMMQNKGDDILYCDTDGFLTTKNNFSVNDTLGGLTQRFEDKPIKLTTLLRSKMYIIDDTVKFKGLFIKVSGNQIRFQIMNNDLSFKKDIILKPRMASRMNLDPLTMWNKPISFSMTPDKKRIYDKNLDSTNLITEFTTSKPIELKVR